MPVSDGTAGTGFDLSVRVVASVLSLINIDIARCRRSLSMWGGGGASCSIMSDELYYSLETAAGVLLLLFLAFGWSAKRPFPVVEALAKARVSPAYPACLHGYVIFAL